MLRADHPNEWKHLENVIDFFQALCLLFWRHVLDVSERQQRARDFLEEFRLLVGNAGELFLKIIVDADVVPVDCVVFPKTFMLC